MWGLLRRRPSPYTGGGRLSTQTSGHPLIVKGYRRALSPGITEYALRIVSLPGDVASTEQEAIEAYRKCSLARSPEPGERLQAVKLAIQPAHEAQPEIVWWVEHITGVRASTCPSALASTIAGRPATGEKVTVLSPEWEDRVDEWRQKPSGGQEPSLER